MDKQTIYRCRSARSATVGLQSLRITSKRCMPVASQVKMGYGCLWRVYYILLHHVWTIFGVFWATWKEQLPTWRQKNLGGPSVEGAGSVHENRPILLIVRQHPPLHTPWPDRFSGYHLLGVVFSLVPPYINMPQRPTSTISHNVWSVYVDSF